MKIAKHLFSSHFGSWKVKLFRRYHPDLVFYVLSTSHPDKHSMNFWTVTVTLTEKDWIQKIQLFRTYHLEKYYVMSLHCHLDTAMQSFNKIFQLMKMSHQSLVVKGSAVQKTETVYSHYMRPKCDHDLVGSHLFFCMTLQLMMMYHHSKFGYKRLRNSEHIIIKHLGTH